MQPYQEQLVNAIKKQLKTGKKVKLIIPQRRTINEQITLMSQYPIDSHHAKAGK